MDNADVLKLLFPLPELGGVFQDDILLEGRELDAVQASAEQLLKEMHPDTAYYLLGSWERVYKLTPSSDDPLQARRDAVIQKMRARGGLSRAYFIALAAVYGWTITIDELLPFMCGWNRCGDSLYIEGVRWIWRVNVSGQAVYSFRAGLSAAGERLTWWVADTVLESLFTELKPAHTYVIFNYD
jgi:uncharacterized protein YmfQ (DUF2313 family)